MGRILLEKGDLSEAERYYRSSFTRRTEIYGPEHPETAKAIRGMGWLCTETREFDTARSHFDDATKIFRKERLELEIAITELGIQKLNYRSGRMVDFATLEEAINLLEAASSPFAKEGEEAATRDADRCLPMNAL